MALMLVVLVLVLQSHQQNLQQQHGHPQQQCP